MFWPKEIWGKFSDDFHAFKKPEHREQVWGVSVQRWRPICPFLHHKRKGY